MAIYPNEKMSFYEGQSRMYDPLLLLFTNLSCLTFTSIHLSDIPPDTANPFYAAYRGKLFNNVLHIPVQAVLLPLFHAPDPNPLEVQTTEDYTLSEVRARGNRAKTSKYLELTAMGSFVNFFEGYRPWLDQHTKANHPTAANEKPFKFWPSVWKMARVVRNAMSHGGRIDWRDAQLAPITWQGLTYSHDDDGRKLFELDLSLADLVLLLIEMGKALDRLGCPIEPPSSE